MVQSLTQSSSEDHFARDCDQPRDPSTMVCRNCDQRMCIITTLPLNHFEAANPCKTNNYLLQRDMLRATAPSQRTGPRSNATNVARVREYL